jgi:hypothetical protein
MNITIMRGLHDIAMVEPVTAEARGADALLMECIGTEQDKLDCLKFMSNMSDSADFADTFNGNEPEIIADTFRRVGWELRKSGIQFALVDETTDDPAALLARQKIFEEADMYKLIESNDFEAFYTSTQNHIQNLMNSIQERDQLVVSQTVSYIEGRQKLGVATNRIVLSQGYIHHTKPLLQKHFPEAVIEEKYYGFLQLNEFEEDPELQLLLHLTANPPIVVTSEHIDLLLLTALLSLKSPSVQTAKTIEPSDMHASIIAQLPIYVERRRCYKELLGESSGDVHRQLEAELAKMRA